MCILTYLLFEQIDYSTRTVQALHVINVLRAHCHTGAKNSRLLQLFYNCLEIWSAA